VGVITELAQYFGKSEDQIAEVLSNRESLFEIEHDIWESVNPGTPLLNFYRDSNLSMISNAQDEIERDLDTDWPDMIQSVLTAPHSNPVGSVLDYGGGIGSAGLNFVSRVPASLHFYEPNKAAARFYKWRADHIYGIDVVQECMMSTRIKYDLIICWGVFEHLTDDVAEVTAHFLKQSLTDQGKIFFKNFYEQTDAYLLHYPRGPKMKKFYAENKDRIIFAKHSH